MVDVVPSGSLHPVSCECVTLHCHLHEFCVVCIPFFGLMGAHMGRMDGYRPNLACWYSVSLQLLLPGTFMFFKGS